MNCTCGRIAVGMEVTEARNWHEDCPEHGVESEWWATTGEEYFRKRTAESVERQRRAREARKRAKEVKLNE